LGVCQLNHHFAEVSPLEKPDESAHRPIDTLRRRFDPVRRLPSQLFQNRIGLIVKGAVESIFVLEDPNLFRRTGRSNDTTPAQFRQLPGHIADGAGGP